MQLCTHVADCVCSNNSNCNRQSGNVRCICSINSNSNQQNERKKYMKFSTFMLNFFFLVLYFISTPSNHSLLHFWFYLRYKNKYVLFDFYFAKFNFLHFISTPSNHLPICIWFYLRYKNQKNYTKLSVVLSGCFFFKVANFLSSSLSQFFLYCWRETCCPDILHQLCKVLLPVSLVVHKVQHWGIL